MEYLLAGVGPANCFTAGERGHGHEAFLQLGAVYAQVLCDWKRHKDERAKSRGSAAVEMGRITIKTLKSTHSPTSLENGRGARHFSRVGVRVDSVEADVAKVQHGCQDLVNIHELVLRRDGRPKDVFNAS